jgi:hypothetical protein
VDDDGAGVDETTRGSLRARRRGKTVWFEIDRES